MKKRIFIPLLLLAVLFLSACGSSVSQSSGGSAAYYDNGYSSAAAEMDYAYDEADLEMGWSAETPAEQAAPEGSHGGTLPENVKIIYSAEIDMESTEFDAAVEKLEALTGELGGWFESSRLDNNSRNYRRAWYTVRVPVQNFEAFCARVGELCRLRSLNRGADDISEKYYDTESRLVTQQTKLARLQDLLSRAEDMEDIITLESAISETELAIENLTGSLRKYDSLVNYSTIDISLSEVYQLTPVEEPVVGFGARLEEAFKAGSRSFVSGMQDFLLGFARAWAGWLLFIAVVVLVVWLIVRARRRRKERGDTRPPREKKPRRGRKAGKQETEAPSDTLPVSIPEGEAKKVVSEKPDEEKQEKDKR